MELNNNLILARGSMDTSSSANPDTHSGSPNQRVEGGTPEGEQPSNVAEEYVKSGKQMVLEALGSLYNTAESSNICLYCGSTQHEHVDSIIETRRSSRTHLKRSGHVYKRKNRPRQKLMNQRPIPRFRGRKLQQTLRLRKRSQMRRPIRQWVKCMTNLST